MAADLEEKTDRYEEMLSAALEEATVAAAPDSPLAALADEFEEMARSYLEDGRHFRADGDPVNALAAFAYGHAWLDAGARAGIFAVPADAECFTV